MDGSESDSERPKERYGESYLAMNAAQKRAAPALPIPRRPKGRGGIVLVFILVTAGLAYLQRARVLPWLEQHSHTGPLLEKIREHFGSREERGGDILKAAGGETTVLGQGSGTVTPDDGSDTFRVIPSPESGTAP